MFFLLGILNGLGEIGAHKLRSLLTITCVMLGVASLVLIAGFITGLFKQWDNYQQEMDWAHRVDVYTDNVPKEQKNLEPMSPGQTVDDATTIRRLSKHAAHVSPVCSSNMMLAFKGNTTQMETKGATPDVLAVEQYVVDRGRFISELDLQRVEPVVVLGSTPADDLFKGREDPIGRTILINREPFRVVGLLHDYQSAQGSFNILERKNRVAFVPITSMQQRLTGQSKLTELTIQADETINVAKAVDEVTSILTRTHRGIHDFKAYTSQENIESFNTMRKSFYVVGCGIGAVTLLVGGIGIMNLMLASINERVREIGIRKAIGAWNRDIFAQFIAEAIALSLLGGLVGVLVGITVIRVLHHLLNAGDISPPELSIPAVLVGLGFSVVIGVVAGLYPAIQASRLDPIEALRYE